jgi:hypothetical protein
MLSVGAGREGKRESQGLVESPIDGKTVAGRGIEQMSLIDGNEAVKKVLE